MSAILGGRPAATASSARRRQPFTRAPVGPYAGSMAVVLLLMIVAARMRFASRWPGSSSNSPPSAKQQVV